MNILSKESICRGNSNDNLYQLCSDDGYYLIVSVEKHEYGFEMNDVVKIVDCDGLYRLPGLPGHLYGGLIIDECSIPVIDLSACFDRGATNIDERCLVIVVNVNGEHVGMLVEYTCGIRNIPSWIVDFSCKFITRIKKEFIKGMATFDQNTFFVLDVCAIHRIETLNVVKS